MHALPPRPQSQHQHQHQPGQQHQSVSSRRCQWRSAQSSRCCKSSMLPGIAPSTRPVISLSCSPTSALQSNLKERPPTRTSLTILPKLRLRTTRSSHDVPLSSLVLSQRSPPATTTSNLRREPPTQDSRQQLM